MTALTETKPEDLSLGNMKGKVAYFATLTDGYTWQTGIGTIIFAAISTTTATAGQLPEVSWSGDTVTVHLEGGTPAGSIFALGYG